MPRPRRPKSVPLPFGLDEAHSPWSGFVDLDQSHAPVVTGASRPDQPEAFILFFDALVIAAILVILLGIKPER